MKSAVSLLLISLLVACATNSPNVPGESDSNIQVMVLGTYHFQASETDLIAVEPDDVRSPQRQAELRRLAESLAAFEPTMIATERISSAPEYVDQGFVSFDQSSYKTSQDERVQVAYRVARAVGTDRVHGIDEQSSDGEPDYFPFDAIMSHAQSTGRAEEIQAMLGSVQSRVETAMADLSNLPIAQALYEVNTGFFSSPEFYYKLLDFDSGEQQPSAELNAYWFMRNAKIFSKLLDLANPGDRVLVIFGAGHKFWLEHLAEQTPGVVLVKPDAYLRAAAR